MLAHGAKAPEVEAVLTKAGLAPAQAVALVEECVTERAMRFTQAAPERKVSWLRIVLGAILIVGGFAWAYYSLLARLSDGPVHVDPRLVPGAAVAIVGLGLIWHEVKAAIGVEK